MTNPTPRTALPAGFAEWADHALLNERGTIVMDGDHFFERMAEWWTKAAAPDAALREAAWDYLHHDGSGVGRTDEWRGDFDAL